VRDTARPPRRSNALFCKVSPAEDKPNINLVVIVLKTADGKITFCGSLPRLGCWLPSGLGLKIDDIDVGRAGFVRCLPTGCVAEVVMEEKLIGQMKSGQKATFIHFSDPEEGNWHTAHNRWI